VSRVSATALVSRRFMNMLHSQVRKIMPAP
jgi:hypothetical protein